MSFLLQTTGDDHASLTWFSHEDGECVRLAHVAFTDYSDIDGSREVKLTLAPGVLLVMEEEPPEVPLADAVLDAAVKVVRP